MTVLDDIKALTGNKDSNPSESSEANHKKILIVEDEKPLANALEDEFKAQGFEVIKAENGEQGLEAVKTQKPHIVLLDLLMPIMDGKAMLRKLREIPEFKALPVIVLTNAGESDNIRETQVFDNAVEFLIKSNVTLDEISTAVKRLIV